MTACPAWDSPHDGGRTLLRSQVECDNCHDVIASIHRHDFQTCHCGAISIDGGRDYLRMAFKDGATWTGRHIWVHGDLNNAQAGFCLAVLKAVGYAYVQHLDPVSTTEVVKAYEAMQRPYPPAFYPTNLRKSVLTALKLLHISHVLRVYDTRGQESVLGGYVWWLADGVKLADRADAP